MMLYKELNHFELGTTTKIVCDGDKSAKVYCSL